MTETRNDDLTPREKFGQHLRFWRETREMSQEELAYLTEMHRTEVSLFERGKREPRLGVLLKFSAVLAVLEVPLGRFFEGIAWTPRVLEATEPGRFVAVSAGEE